MRFYLRRNRKFKLIKKGVGMSLVKCKACGHEISKSALSCPNCGEPKKVKKKTSFSTWFILFLVVSFMIGSFISDQKEEERRQAQAKKDEIKLNYFNSHKGNILKTVNELITTKKYSDVITLSKEYEIITDSEFTNLVNKAKEHILLSEAKEIPASNVKENLKAYKKLVELDPTNQVYKAKVSNYQKKVDRVELIEKQFSPWDGSHIALERILKKASKNPDSYEHVKTVYWDKGDYIIVETTYRGTNSFNAVVTGTQKASFSLDGSLINIL